MRPHRSVSVQWASPGRLEIVLQEPGCRP